MILQLPNGWETTTIDKCAQVNPKIEIPAGTERASFIAMADVSVNGKIIGGSVISLKGIGNGYTEFAENDVLVAKITPCFENGKGAMVRNIINKIGFGSTEFHVLRANQEVILPEFLFVLTRTHRFRSTGEFNMSGSAGQKRVPTDFLRSYVVHLPPIVEQRSMIEILEQWDIAIEKTGRMIDAKRLHYSALSNNLLSRKYSALPLKKFLTLTLRDVAKPDKPYWALGIRSHGKGTFRRFVENPQAVAMDTLYKVQHDDIIVNITFAWEGAIALVKETDEDCFVSHRFPTYEVDINKSLPDYLRHVIVRKRFIRNLGLISPGGAGRNRVLNVSG